jgi:DNA polymerase epsilon subunit 1
LRKWLKDNSLVNFDLRSILDWEYYIERLGSVIQKLITIPAAMQKVANPVPRIAHPDWLHRRIVKMTEKFKQNKMTDFFGKKGSKEFEETQPMDIEDAGVSQGTKTGMKKFAVIKKKVRERTPEIKDLEEIPIPNPNLHYRDWIRAMRPRWKQRRELRNGGDSASVIIPSMFKGAKVQRRNRWDIVQIRPSSTPGRFILWLSVGSELVSAPIRIPVNFTFI